MCGICGIASFDGPPDLGLLRRMTARLHHRGPDGNGWFRDAHAALGHSRLAIVDTAGGAQPMANAERSVWVTFNGEIFNYVELAEELRGLGHRFRTASDTEVIVHAWEQWGQECFDRFNGQWALGLWDRRDQRLVLSRDRLGVRPLYLTHGNGQVRFASEVKALFADPALDRAFDPVGLEQTFTYWSTVAPRTVFRGIEQLEPGHVAVFDRTGLRRRAYWSITFPPRGNEPVGDLHGTTQELRERLVTATRLRFLRSDVPVGAYLSGGLDSSVTAAIIRAYTDVPLHTFSLRFEDPDLDEGSFQQQMARRLGTDHRDVVVGPGDVAEVFPEVVRHAETPVLRAAAAPMFLLSRLVADNGFKVVVTGEGADEVLGGYDLFREAAVRLFWSRDPASARRARATELLYPWMARSPGRAPAFARSFFGRNLDPADPAVSHRPRWDSTSVIKNLLSAELREELSRSPMPDLPATPPVDAREWDPLCRAQWWEMTTLLPGYLLASQGDRMLMANSVEGRFPFLDRDVVEFAGRLPTWQKLLGLEEKYLLKRAFADLVPATVRQRPKQPYRAPDAAAFFGAARPDWLEEIAGEHAVKAAGVFEPGPVAGLFAKCARTRGAGLGNTDNMRALAVLSTQLVHDHFIAHDGSTGRDSGAGLPEPSVAVDLLPEEGKPR